MFIHTDTHTQEHSPLSNYIESSNYREIMGECTFADHGMKLHTKISSKLDSVVKSKN